MSANKPGAEQSTPACVVEQMLLIMSANLCTARIAVRNGARSVRLVEEEQQVWCIRLVLEVAAMWGLPSAGQGLRAPAVPRRIMSTPT